MPKTLFTALVLAVIGVVIGGFLFWHFYYRELLQIGRMHIAAVDLNRVPNGTHTGSYTTPYKSYHVQVRVAENVIRAVDIRPADNYLTTYDRKAMALPPRIVAAQRIDVDVISGATVTSKAILKAVENALISKVM